MLTFCGREEELTTLISRWDLARNLDAPEPQVVVLSAERGLGKTRLAAAFYDWLQAEHAAKTAYWPAGLQANARSLQVNPDPMLCDYQAPIPFLWWGLRAADTMAENAVSGDALATYDRFLAPHLMAMDVYGRSAKTGKAVSDLWLKLAKDELLSWSGYDTVVNLGKTLFKTIGILQSASQSRAPLIANEVTAAPLSRVAAMLEDLERLFNPKSARFARVPGVIFVDDAQFLGDDPALPLFIEELMARAVAQSWPVMILLTHWRRDLSPQFLAPQQSFARIYHHATGQGQPRPGAKVVGDYLNRRNSSVMQLRVIEDLSLPLKAKLPGLTLPQQQGILRQAGGNPRHLEQIIAYLLENPVLFEEHDPSQALTEAGLSEALAETHDLVRVVEKRLREAPEPVREALALASVQGMRFVAPLVEALAQMQLGRSCRAALAQAHDPYSMLLHGAPADGIGEFAEWLFFDVARRQRRNLRSLCDSRAVTEGLKEVLRAAIERGAPSADLKGDAAAYQLTLALAAQVFDDTCPKERPMVLRSLAALAAQEWAGHSPEAALLSAKRYAEVLRHSAELASAAVDPADQFECALILAEHAALADAREVLSAVLHGAQFRLWPESGRIAAVARFHLGRLSLMTGDYDGARDSFEAALAALGARARREHRVQDYEDAVVVALALVELGRKTGALDLALERAGEAVATARQLLRQSQDDAGRVILRTALTKEGEVLEAAGESAEARIRHEEALTLARQCCDANAEAQRGLIVAINKVAAMQLHAGEAAAASAHYGEALALARDLDRRLATPQSQRDLWYGLLRYGEVQERRGASMVAFDLMYEALAVARAMEARLQSPEARVDLAISLRDAAAMAERLLGQGLGRLDGAAAAAATARMALGEWQQEYLRLLQASIREAPRVEWIEECWRLEHEAGRRAQSAGHFDEALAHYAQAARHGAALLESLPKAAEASRKALFCGLVPVVSRAQLLSVMQRYAEAAQDYATAITLIETRCPAPRDGRLSEMLIDLYAGKGKALLERDDFRAAARAYQNAIREFDQLSHEALAAAELAPLPSYLMLLANCYYRGGHFGAALQALQRYLAILRASPSFADALWRADLLAGLNIAGFAALELGDWGAAQAYRAEAEAMYHHYGAAMSADELATVEELRRAIPAQ